MPTPFAAVTADVGLQSHTSFSGLVEELRTLRALRAMASGTREALEELGALSAAVESVLEEQLLPIHQGIFSVSHQIALQHASTLREVHVKMQLLAEYASGDPQDLVSSLAMSAARDVEELCRD